jgi:copper chaperone CopZ
VSVALKGVNGVESVEVSLNKGLATVTLKPGNTVTMARLQNAITKNGFTTKQSKVTVIGTLAAADGKLTLRVSGSNESFTLLPEGQNVGDFRQLAGKPVTVEGVVPELAKGAKPDKILFHSIAGV